MTILVVPLELGTVELPSWRPRAADKTCLIRGFAIRHPDGVILFDPDLVHLGHDLEIVGRRP